MRPHTSAVLQLPKGERVDVEVHAGVFILILVNEVHHLLSGMLALLDAGFLTPLIDCIGDGGVNIFANVLERFA